MGKKAKSKARNPRKFVTRAAASSSPRASKQADPVDQVETETVADKEPCEHYKKDSTDINQVLSKVQSSYGDSRCVNCRDEPVIKRDNKGKNNNRKKGRAADSVGSESSIIWVCLTCSHFGCGGGVDISKPYGHARRHAKQNSHSFALRLDKPLACWCFQCDSSIHIEMPSWVNAELKSVKGIDNVGSNGDADHRKKSENEDESLTKIVGKGYAVRGLVNLGNTCFFNSVMQNLFALDMLRLYFSSLSATIGPLTMALRKLFSETCVGTETKGTVNPKNLFGCICSKAPQFKGYQQQDSHELLRYLLDGLSTEDMSVRKSLVSSDAENVPSQVPSTFVDDMFGGQLSSTVCCIECGHTSKVYEPFLDLSLPVPAKKVPPKKASVHQSKRTKIPPTSKARKARERLSTKFSAPEQCKSKTESLDVSLVSKEQIKTEPVSLTTESSASYSTPAHEQEETTSADVGGYTWWMDFIGPAPQSSEDPALYDSENREMCQGKDDLLCLPELPTNVCSQDLVMPVESSGGTNEISLQVQVEEVLQPPQRESNLTTEQMNEATSESRKPDVPVDESLLNESSAATSSFVGCEPADVEYDGLGDLFAEPEVTSDLSMEATICEDTETSWTGGAGSESNQEEVDNTNAPVSVVSCLAYFTKPELLTDEHAWHCENCSKILQCQNMAKSKSNQAFYGDDMPEALNQESTTDNKGSHNVKFSLDNMSADSSLEEVLENGKLDISAENVVSDTSNCRDTCLDDNAGENFCNSSEIFCAEDKLCQPGNKNLSQLSSPDVVCQDDCYRDPEKDGKIADCSTSEYVSCTSTNEKTDPQINSSNQQSDSCSNIEMIDDGCEIQSLEEGPKMDSNCREEIAPSANGNCSNVRKVRKKAAKIFPQMNKSEEKELGHENAKVKRDATKRILINKVPPILTIHLKRFSQDVRGRLNKLSGQVNFQEMLDLAPYMDTRCRGVEKFCYRLVGVVEHSGNMRGGHYIAYVRGERSKGKSEKDGPSGTWFYASDAHVREVSLTEVLQSEAYILFYERV